MALGDIVLAGSSDELRDGFLRDIRLAAIDTGLTDTPPTTPGTDWFLLGESSGRLAFLCQQNVSASDQGRSVLTATGDDLIAIRDGAGLPEVPPSGSTGKIVPTISGATTIVDGSVFILPNGFRAKVVGTHVNPVQGDELDVASIDVGDAANLDAGEVVRFVNPPVNVAVEALVSTGSPLVGGTDVESDERLRERILNAYKNKPAGGNWGYYRELVLGTLGSVTDCFVYPALGGPATQKIVPVKDFSPDENDFSRSASAATLTTLRSTIFGKTSVGIQTVLQATVDLPVDTSLKITIPASSLSGGNGQGWTNSFPWPNLITADSGRVRITAVGSGSPPTITVSANTTTLPVAAQTQIAWWSSTDRLFYTALILGASGSPGAYVLTLDRPLIGKNGAVPAVGDFICPAAQNLVKYGTTWIDYFRTLGPGENAPTAGSFLPRALRRPFVTVESPASITSTALTAMTNNNAEVTNVGFAYQSATDPGIPATVADAPLILTPRSFAVYPL